MIPAGPGAAFSLASDGDLRAKPDLRTVIGGPPEWATVTQVHGDRVVTADRPGDHGEADAVVTTNHDLSVAVFTADCLGIVLHGPDTVAAVHAGWRGLAADVVSKAVAAVGTVTSAVIGPHIGPCCYEVGPEVAERFDDHVRTTTWGTTSVDLAAAATEQLGIEPAVVDRCTRCGTDTFSHRRDRTPARMAAVGWLP